MRGVGDNIEKLESFDRIVGIDPGVNTLFTGNVNDGSFVSASRKEYLHMSNMNKQKFRMKNLKARKPEYRTICENMLSLKLATIEKCKEALRFAYTVVDQLFDFHHKYGFHKWRFKTKIMSEKGLAKLVNRITNNKKTLCWHW